MSETPPADETKPWNMPRQRVSEKTKIALLAVIEAARYVKKPNLKAIALRCNVKYSTLKQTWYKFNKGLIDLGEPETPEERQVETKVEMARTLQLVSRAEQFLNDQFEGVMVAVKDAAAEGDKEAYFKYRVPDYVASLLQLARLRETKEKGFMSLLENAQKEINKMREEKQMGEAKVVPVAARVVRATEAQALEAAFTDGRTEPTL